MVKHWSSLPSRLKEVNCWYWRLSTPCVLKTMGSRCSHILLEGVEIDSVFLVCGWTISRRILHAHMFELAFWLVRISVQFSCSVVSDSLRPHGLQHTRPPCPSPTPGVYPNSCPLSWWCHPTISSSVIPFSSCLQSFPASGSFQMSQLFTSGGQSIRVSASTSVLPMNIQDWSPLGWTDRISLQSKGLSRVFPNTIVQKHQFFGAQLSLQSALTFIHDY